MIAVRLSPPFSALTRSVVDVCSLRVEYFPALGWMMTRAAIQELLNKWPSGNQVSEILPSKFARYGLSGSQVM